MDNIIDETTLEEIIGGHSGSKLYKLKCNDNIYCIKLVENSKQEFNVIKTICNIYSILGIPSLKLIAEGQNKQSENYVLYNYIEGSDLKTLSKQLSDSKIYEYGIKTGEYLKKLKNFSLEDANIIPTVDINKLTDRVNELYKSLMQNHMVKNLFEEYFTIEKIKMLIKKHNEYKSLFNESDLHLIHGDIKMSNTMIDKEGNFYLIDIESMKFSYDVLNFRYQIVWKLMKGNEKELLFTKGMLDRLYNYTRPESFYEQLIYVFVLNFVEHTNHISNNEEKLINFFQNIKDVFLALDKFNTEITESIKYVI